MSSGGLQPEKELRRKLESDGDQKRLTELHKINNETRSKLESMQAKSAMFCRWGLRMNGGIRELAEGAEATDQGINEYPPGRWRRFEVSACEEMMIISSSESALLGIRSRIPLLPFYVYLHSACHMCSIT